MFIPESFIAALLMMLGGMILQIGSGALEKGTRYVPAGNIPC